MRRSGNNRPSLDRQDAELERLRKERDELRAREQKARADADKAKERLANLTSASRTFASSMRVRAEESRHSRRRLATQHAMTRALAEARNLEEATPDILKILGDGLGWAIGILWMVDEEAGVLRCDAVWRSSESPAGAFEAACRNASIRPGEGLPGRVWARSGPVWVEDVLDNEGFLWAEAAARDGLHAALAFPIQNDTTVGVLALLGEEASPPDDELLLLATIIGGQIGQFAERRRAEEALRRSEERQRSLIAATSSIVWTAAANGEFVEEIPSWQHFTGQTPARYKGFGWLHAVHPEDRPGAWKDLSENETPVETRYRLMRHDGQYCRVISRGVPILDGDGEVCEWIGTVTDVEDELRAEEVLRETDERLRTVVESAPVILFALDSEGVFTLSAGRGLKALGLEPGEGVGRSAFEVYTEQPGILEDTRRALLGEAFAASRAVDGVEFETRYGPIRSLDGEVAGVIGVSTDVTERKQAEAERDRFFELSPDLLCITGLDGYFRRINPAFERVLGYTEEEFFARPFVDFVHPEDRAETLAELEELQKGDATLQLETRFSRKDGSQRWVLWTAIPVVEEGTVYKAGRDITGLKQAEEERERFLAQEWVARAEAAERRRIGRELHDRVAHSMGVVHQSIELYRAFLQHDPSRAEAKLALAQEMAKTALNSTRDLSMALRESAADENLKDSLSNFLENSVPPEIRARLSVEGDESSIPTRAREQLFLILREAARNAVSHSECSRLSICLDTTVREVVGLVEDDGRGFEPDGSTNGGSGLRYMKERAALVKGVCEVSSEPSGGTSVRVSIPLEPGQ